MVREPDGSAHEAAGLIDLAKEILGLGVTPLREWAQKANCFQHVGSRAGTLGSREEVIDIVALHVRRLGASLGIVRWIG